MNNLKIKLIVAVVGLVGLARAEYIDWAGGTGQWTNGANWVGGSVPDVAGADSAVISSGTVIYVPNPVLYPPWGDLQVDLANKLIIDGGSLEQSSTAWMKFYQNGQFEISNGGSYVTGANVVHINGGGACSVDGPSSLLEVTGNNRVSIENSSSLSLTGGATAECTTLNVTLWIDAQFNISDNSVARVKNLFIEGWEETPSRVNLSDAARLHLVGNSEDVITVMPGSFVNFELGCTGYVNINGINQADLESMIADGKFGIQGLPDTAVASYAITTNLNAVNIGLVTPPVPDPYLAGLWLGGNGDWFDSAKWSGGALPLTDGGDDVIISSPTNIVVSYVPGPDLVFNAGSDLLLDGATLYQDSTTWTAFYRGSELTITNGGTWLFESAHMLIFGYGTGEAVHTVDNGVFAVRELEIDDHQVFIVTNGATASVTVYSDISNGARIEVTDATLNIGEVALYEYEGNDSFIHVNDGASVNLDAGFYPEGLRTNVIQKTGNSMVNFAADSSGTVFIDNISRADVEALINQGKFGEGGIVNTDVSSYTIIAEGAGQRVQTFPMPVGTLAIDSAGGDTFLSWESFDGQQYEIQDKIDMAQSAWGTYSNLIGLGGNMSVTVSVENAATFYRVISD
jgi:hypothetical protein